MGEGGPGLYILGKETQIYVCTHYIYKISVLLLSEIKEMLTNLLNATFVFLNNASYWDQSQLFKQNVDFCSEQI